MTSGYFNLKTGTQPFKERLENIFKELEGKRVIVYGAGEGFSALDKMFDFSKRLNVVAISDIKFTKEQDLCGYRAVAPEQIKNIDCDAILVTQESYKSVLHYLRNTLCIEDKSVYTVFEEEIPDEAKNFNYLYDYDFEKNLSKLTKKLHNKKVVVYGTGALFQLICKYFDLGGLNIVAISDMKFDAHEKDEEFLGYRVCSPVEIEDYSPDYVLVATRQYINIAEDLHCYTLKGTGIKVRPLVKKPFKAMLAEIWDSSNAK